MWEEIALSVGLSVLEAIGTNFFEERKKEQLKSKLSDVISEQFHEFANTSLNCSDFYCVIKSCKFVEMMRNYFFLIDDGYSREQYISNIESLICDICPTIVKEDVKIFIIKIEVIYIDVLHKIIEDYPEIYASFQLMSISHREIISHIRDSQNELKRYLDSLEIRKNSFDDENIEMYHAISEKEFGEIRFTGISGAERRRAQNVNEFYVENTFHYYGKNIDKLYNNGFEKIESVKLENFFDLGNKIVLIGGAGLGKSTTLNYMFCNYEKLYGEKAFKLKIDLKEYAKEIGVKKKGLLWCIANEFIKRTKYLGLSIEKIQAAIAKNLCEGRCLVILDALDEIPTQSLRNIIRNEIANFSSIYYLNRFVISTREVGYLKNRFDETFLHIRINKFGAKQIEQYSKNWHKSYYEEDENFDEFWQTFMDEVSRARCGNLISNPIILVLALVIFDGGKSLPTRRVEFYQKCIKTFLEDREDRKAIENLDTHAKSILFSNLTVPQIAFYKYHKLRDNAGYKFSYSELRRSVIESLGVENKMDWEMPVKQFSDYLVERTELIQEIDEDTLDFAHKTFYEYFLAFYFAKMYNNSELGTLLYNWIGDSNCDELARLIVEVVIQNNEPRQHNYVMDCLFELLTKADESGVDGPSKSDVFSLIADLYSHNMLLPKYHRKYNSFVLYNSIYVYYENNFLQKNIYQSLSLYDSQAVAEMFIKDYKENKLADVIDTLRYLNNDFKKRVMENDDFGLLFHIKELFSFFDWNISKINMNSVVDELKYFLNDGLEYTKKYPQIYATVVSVIFNTQYDYNLENLLEYEFEPRCVFYRYASPIALSKFIQLAEKSKVYFALMLILFVDCAYQKTNALFLFAIRRMQKKHKREKEFFLKNGSFCINVWKTLNTSDTYDCFMQKIIEMNLYDENYDHVYKKVFCHYQNNEKVLNEERIKKLIKKRNIH